MKITDYALIFIAVTLPFILIAYINIALTIRTYQQEMYYQKVIDAAVEDSLSEMKRIESDEITNDFGYSGNVDNKVSINASVGVSTFFDSLYNSLDLYGDKTAQEKVQLYVPVIAIVDYNGVYISSIEKFTEGGQTVLKHVLKPKRYFAFEYAIYDDDRICIVKDGKWMFANNILDNTDDVEGVDSQRFLSIHNIEFTTDDRIFHTVSEKIMEQVPRKVGNKIVGMQWVVTWSSLGTKEFYMSDKNNNERLFLGMKTNENKEKLLSELQELRKEILVNVVTQELVYAANKNNEYARNEGISYNFSFTVESDDEMYNYIQNVGMLALVQGIRVGNRYLSYKAYNVSDLVVTHHYFLTTGSTKFANNLYHKTKNCLEYEDKKDNIITSNNGQNIAYTREMAASLGYYPCPLCNP